VLKQKEVSQIQQYRPISRAAQSQPKNKKDMSSSHLSQQMVAFTIAFLILFCIFSDDLTFHDFLSSHTLQAQCNCNTVKKIIGDI
jgi:hypothetical protein